MLDGCSIQPALEHCQGQGIHSFNSFSVSPDFSEFIGTGSYVFVVQILALVVLSTGVSMLTSYTGSCLVTVVKMRNNRAGHFKTTVYIKEKQLLTLYRADTCTAFMLIIIIFMYFYGHAYKIWLPVISLISV